MSGLPRAVIMMLLLAQGAWLLSGCSPAKYRGWGDGDRYFSGADSHDDDSDLMSSGSSKCPRPYIVKYGDTLSGIAVKCQVNMLRLADENDLMPPYHLSVKQELKIPRAGSKNKAPPTIAYSGKTKFHWPTKKDLQYRFETDAAGMNSLKVLGQKGEGIYAAAAGKVVYAGDGISHYGFMVVIKHPSNHLTVYAHNDSLQVKEGQQVKQGQLIATLGETGDVDEPQLYMEARYKGRKMDIKKLLKQPK